MHKTDAITEGTDRARARAQRTCVGCRSVADRDALVRLVEGPGGQIAVDPKTSLGGRGAWVHPTRSCIELAARRHGAERTLKISARAVDAEALIAQARESFARRALGLLSSAVRARAVSVGMDVAAQSVSEGRASLLLLASDAGESTRARAEELASLGVTLRVFSTRGALGALFNRGEVAIAAVEEPRVSAELVLTIDRYAGLEG
jgi:predicted RNA-binding protein YlxR (DUF448 family)/ribosomal protein L30E